MEFDASMFNFETMKQVVGADPFAQEANKYAKDERFYTLTKDKDGNGAALIRFLPDSERGMIQRMYKINSTIIKNGKKRFCSEFSPTNIGLPDPFQEEWQRLWNEDQKDEAKKFGRGVRYIVNIKVLKDPACPENEGKIFLYEMSGSMKDKIQNAVDPSEQDRALGATPKELFNPLKGNSFRLVSKKGANGQINYDSSEVVNDVTSIYSTVEEAVEDIKNNTHKLSDLLKPEAFMSYDELCKKMAWVKFEDSKTQNSSDKLDTTVAESIESKPTVVEVQPAQPAQSPQPDKVAEPEPPKQTQPSQSEKSKSLDDLLGMID